MESDIYGIPIIYPYDWVRVSSRWAGDSGLNADFGKNGEVSSIELGFQGVFNREYHIAQMDCDNSRENGFQAWIYTLDIVAANDRIGANLKKSFGGLPYIGDTIKVASWAANEKKGKEGKITRVSSGDRERKGLIFDVRDSKVESDLISLYKEVAARAEVGLDEDFAAHMSKMPAKYLEVLENPVTRRTYKGIFFNRRITSLSSEEAYVKKTAELNESLIFRVEDSELDSVKRTPQNLEADVVRQMLLSRLK